MKTIISIIYCIILSQLQLVAQPSLNHQSNNSHQSDMNLIISSILNFNGNYKFSVYDPVLKRRFWISSGKSYNGYTFLEYNKSNSCVRLAKENTIIEVPIIKTNELPVQILVNSSKLDLTLENVLPTTAEIQAYKQLQYKNLPDQDAENYQLLKNSADNRIEIFSSTPIENTNIENRATNDSHIPSKGSLTLGGRKGKAKVKTTVHSSVFIESQNKTDD